MPESKSEKSTLPAIPRTGVLQLRWNPGELHKPTVQEDLQVLDPLVRGSEVIRFNLLRFEFWISPKGTIREWLRWNFAVGITLSIPTLVIVPVVTYLLTQFVTWTALLVEIVKNLLIFPILAVAFIGLVSGMVLFIRIIGRR